MTGAIKKADLVKVALRMIFIQTSWSEGGMQSEALAYCLAPALRRLYPDGADLDEALRRYRTPFNTHPYLAGMIAGNILKMEQDGAPPKKIGLIVRGTMGPLAAMGDPFFKAAMAPAAAAIGCAVALLAGPIPGVVALLLAFNTVHVLVRVSSVFTGFRKGEMAMADLATWIGPSRTRIIKTAASALVGVVLVLTVLRFGVDIVPGGAIAGGACVVGGLLLTGRRSVWAYATPVLLAVFLALELLL